MLHLRCQFGRYNASFQNILHYSTTTTTTSPTNGSYANFLVHSLGFSQQEALSISTKLSLKRRNKVIDSKFVQNANTVVTLFRNLGFQQTHIRQFVSKEPQLLASNIEKTLKTKIRLLQDEDFSRSDVIRVISSRPTILFYGLESTILPVMQILRQVMGSVCDVVNTMEMLSEKNFYNIVKCLLPNVALLSSHGVGIELIRKHMLYQPRYLMQNPEVFKDVFMKDAMKLGITLHSPTTNSYADYIVQSLGVSHQQALPISAELLLKRRNKVIDSKFVNNANSVVTLFCNLGFQQTHIRQIVSKEPQLLASNIEKTLKTKIRLLQDEGFSWSHIIRVISRRPEILWFGFETTILPAIQILRQVMGSDCNVINTMERLSESYFRNVAKCLLPNVALLRSSYGVPIELIRKHMLKQPGYFVRNPVVFKYLLTRDAKKFGLITRHSPMKLYHFNLISAVSEETFESKFRIFKSFGWTQSDVETFLMKNVSYFTFSDESIKKKLDFLMNELQLKPAYLTSHNHFITCSLEKRIAPRHKIFMILKERCLLKNNPSFYSAIRISEPCFLKRFVLPFKEVHQAYAKLTGSRKCC